MHNLPKNTTEIGDYPILSAVNICNGNIDFSSKRYVDEDTFIKENKRTNLQTGDVLLTIVATIGRTAVIKERNMFLLQRSVCVIKPNNTLNPLFLKYYLDTTKMQAYMRENAHGSAQAGLYLKQVSNMFIPVPTIEKQQEIIKKLDKFDNLVNDLTEGLPAEIDARQKQYEYYRNKLRRKM